LNGIEEHRGISHHLLTILFQWRSYYIIIGICGIIYDPEPWKSERASIITFRPVIDSYVMDAPAKLNAMRLGERRGRDIGNLDILRLIEIEANLSSASKKRIRNINTRRRVVAFLLILIEFVLKTGLIYGRRTNDHRFRQSEFVTEA